MFEKKVPFFESFLPVIIFLFFFCVFLIVNFSGPQLSSPDDPAYHIAHALSYNTNVEWQYPVYSTLSEKPVDIWWLYHIFLSKFLQALGGVNYEDLVMGTKIFHSVAAALVFVTFYFVLRGTIARETGLTRRDIVYLSIIGSALLFFVFPSFTFRLYLYRPHLFSIILVLLSLYFTIGRNWRGIFFAAFLAPFFYSLSPFVLIPPLLYCVSSALYFDRENFAPRTLKSEISKRRPFWKRLLSMGGIEHFAPLLVSLLGLISGIAARPDSLNYIYNGIYIPLRVIFNFFFLGVDRIGELYAAFPNDLWGILFVIFFIAVCFAYYVRIYSRGLRSTLSREKFYVFITAQFFFGLMIFISRASEYAVPLMLLFVVWSLTGDVLPQLRRVMSGNFSTQSRGAVAAELCQAGKILLRALYEKRRIIRRGIHVTIFVITIGIAASLVMYLKNQPPLDQYRGAAEYMKRYSSAGDIVFQQRFDVYPRLVFYNRKNRYITGISESFTYAHNPELYWRWIHTVDGGPICPRRKCDDMQSEDPYDVIKNNFRARYVFIDASTKLGPWDVDNNQKFIDVLNSDSRFSKVYTDPKYPEIMVYALSG